MTRRPTPKPLTKTERTELDKLIRRAAGAINSADGSRLVRLLDLDQADRAQERRTAGGVEGANREFAQKLKAAEAELAALHEGEEPIEDERLQPSPAQWIWLWNRATPAERLARAERSINEQAIAHNCRLMHPRGWAAYDGSVRG